MPLAALLEGGLPLIERPLRRLGRALGRTVESRAADAAAAGWTQGTLRRFGAIVRHHELGFDANAMTVFDVPDAQVDACGAKRSPPNPASRCAYRRERAEGWPYNLYCMVHGRDRRAVRDADRRGHRRAGLATGRTRCCSPAAASSRPGAALSRPARRRPMPAPEAPMLRPTASTARLIDRLHGDLPLTERPFADVAANSAGPRTTVIERLRRCWHTAC
jgi:DNA-binding Lrp family transcriptional regulator